MVFLQMYSSLSISDCFSVNRVDWKTERETHEISLYCSLKKDNLFI